MKNRNGVVVELTTSTVGVNSKLAASGVSLTLEQWQLRSRPFIDRQEMIQQARATRDSYRIPPAGQFRQLPLVERRLRLGLLWMKSGGAVEHPLRHVPQTVLAHAEPHDARSQPDGADHVLLLDGDSPDLLA